MIKKEVSKYERKKGTGIYTYRINVNIKDNLDNEVYIYNYNEYQEIQNQLAELKELKSKYSQLKTIQELETLIKEITETNNNNINKINKDHNKQVQDLTALNTILITGLKTIKETSLLDRITNKNKSLATEILDNNTKQISKYKVLETVKED